MWNRYNIILSETDILLRPPQFSRQRCTRSRNPLLPTWVVTTAIRLRKSERMVAAATLDTLVRRRLFPKRTRNVSHYRDGFREKISHSGLAVPRRKRNSAVVTQISRPPFPSPFLASHRTDLRFRYCALNRWFMTYTAPLRTFNL